MNGQVYFEENPWDRACRVVEQKGLGKIEQIIAQCVCEKGALEATLSTWKARVEMLVGTQRDGNLLKNEHVIAFIGTFGENTLVRFFFDDGAEDVSENFEIVTEKSLIVWKPINTNQGHLMASNNYFIQSKQDYVADLENGAKETLR